MKILKYLFELIFVFILPICFIFISFKYKTINQYDSSGNLITSEKILDYSDNTILRDYKDNLQYKNILKSNEILINNQLNDLNHWTVNTLQSSIILDDYVIKEQLVVSPSWTYSLGLVNNTTFNFYNTHKYLIQYSMFSTIDTQASFYCNSTGLGYLSPVNVPANTWTVYQYIFQPIYNGSSNYNYFNNNNRSLTFTIDDYILYKDIQLIDLTVMFGSGFEPTVQEFNLYTDNSIIYYGEEQDFYYYSNDIISSSYDINYTWYTKFFNNFFNELDFNHNNFAKLIIIYLVLTVVFFFFWNLIYWPLSLLFRLLLWKKTYY